MYGEAGSIPADGSFVDRCLVRGFETLFRVRTGRHTNTRCSSTGGMVQDTSIAAKKNKANHFLHIKSLSESSNNPWMLQGHPILFTLSPRRPSHEQIKTSADDEWEQSPAASFSHWLLYRACILTTISTRSLRLRCMHTAATSSQLIGKAWQYDAKLFTMELGAHSNRKPGRVRRII